jgi:hypothetical protein
MLVFRSLAWIPAPQECPQRVIGDRFKRKLRDESAGVKRGLEGVLPRTLQPSDVRPSCQ